MPGSKRTFSYSLTPKDAADLPKVAARARKILAWACEGDDRITCHSIDGEAIGRVTMNLTIIGRDRWWAMQLAQDILNLVTWQLKADVSLDLRSTRLPPHENRGYVKGNRTKRWNDPKPQRGAQPQESATGSEPGPPEQ